MRLHNILLLSFLTLFVIAACNMFNEPTHNNPNRNVTLNVEDASCTEAWIEVNFTDVEFPAELRFYINDSLAESITAVKDTLLYIEGLQPSRTYRVRAEAVKTQELMVKSNTAEVTTMDTTSHNFTWETYTFGGSGGSSYLRDVAIINENDIWAVGEINIADTTNPNGYTTYNAVHWNGQEWELKRIMWDNSVSRLTCIYAFSSDDIWFGVTNLIHWNGEVFEKNWNPVLNEFTDKTVYSIWGTSSSDLYIVGAEGKIAHYNGSSWEKIESGTEMPITDIWGVKNMGIGETKIMAIASNTRLNEGCFLLKIKNNETIQLDVEGLTWSLSGIWFSPKLSYYIVGSGIFKKNIRTGSWERYPIGSITYNYSESIRGENSNDIVVGGCCGSVIHFNGETWYEYEQLLNNQTEIKKVQIKNNIMIAVGNKYTGGFNDLAIIYLGRR